MQINSLPQVSMKFTEAQAVFIGHSIRNTRKIKGFRIVDIESLVGVNRGQISRFESGDFKNESNNLQKILKFLQIEDPGDLLTRQKNIIERIEKLMSKSGAHQSALLSILDVLEAFP